MTSDGAPLAGVRVLDLSSTLAAPHCTWLLGCLGADVIKVEPPGGDYSRAIQGGNQFANINRNKRSVIADLRTEDGRAFADELARRTDVLVESFKPGAAQRFGLSYERVREHNPTVVYASVSGFGQDGPYSDRPGYDAVAQAMSGLMAATGDEDGPPVRVGTAPVDYGTGVYTAMAISSALLKRERTGEGSRIDASLLETAMTWMSLAYTHYSVTGELPRRRGTANDAFVPYQVFPVSDGDVFVGVATDPMFQAFCREFGLDDLADDPRFRTIPGRVAHRDEVIARVGGRLLEFTADDTLTRLHRLRIPASQVLTVDRILTDPHVVARGAAVTVDDPTVGPITATPFPVVMTGVSRGAGTPAPTPGQHTDEVRRELGLDAPTRAT